MLAQEAPRYDIKQDPLGDLWTQLFVFGRSLTFFNFAVNSKLVTLIILFSIEPLIPYNVTVVAVNLAGPGEKETTHFFTRQGGVFLTNHVYGKLLVNFYFHFCGQLQVLHQAMWKRFA